MQYGNRCDSQNVCEPEPCVSCGKNVPTKDGLCTHCLSGVVPCPQCGKLMPMEAGEAYDYCESCAQSWPQVYKHTESEELPF